MVQEGTDERGVEVGQAEPVRARPGALLGEAEQEPEGVAVGGDGVGTHPALGHQPLGEERFQARREVGHLVTRRAWRRRAAAASSGGEADRYQYVDAGLAWPR